MKLDKMTIFLKAVIFVLLLCIIFRAYSYHTKDNINEYKDIAMQIPPNPFPDWYNFKLFFAPIFYDLTPSGIKERRKWEYKKARREQNILQNNN